MKYITFLLVFIMFIQCNSQEKILEEVYNDCYFNSMPNKGEQLKKLTKQYEKALIEHGYLKDNSGESYYNLFRRIVEPDFKDDKTNFYFIDSVNKLSFSGLIHKNVDCSKKITSLPNYNVSRTYKLFKSIDSLINSEGFDIIKNTNDMINLYNKKDFELDYYKIRVLLKIPNDKNTYRMENKITSKEREKSLTIEVIDKKRVVINGENKSIKSIRLAVSKYIKANKEDSFIIIASKRDVLYANFIVVQNEIISSINTLKNELAQSRFGNNYDNITKEQKDLINQEYSFKITDEVLQ